MTQEQLPAFATNNPTMTVAAEINKMYRIIRSKLAVTPAAAIATAYINPAGFALLADELEQVPRVRLLLGAEPQEDIVRAIAGEDEGVVERIAAAVAEHDAWMKAERDTMGFERLASRNAQHMVEWLRSENEHVGPRVEVRRYTEGFLHGKAYISDDSMLAAVLAGSSNMTLAGLSRNAELNLGYPAGDPNYVRNVRDWFEDLWDASEPYDLAGYYEQQWAPHSARTPRWMNETVYDRAYDAWAMAQESIHARWQELTDPNNLQPDSPKSFRDAFDLVRAEGGFLDDQRGMLQRLRAVPSKKVEKAVRRALNDGRTPRERIELVLSELDAAGIQPPPPVKPLPSVALGEVRLVAWMAVKGKPASQ